MSEKHPGGKEVFLDIIAWLCETPISSFGWGVGVGIFGASPLFFIPSLFLAVATGWAIRMRIRKEKMSIGNMSAFMFGCISGIFLGAIVIVLKQGGMGR